MAVERWTPERRRELTRTALVEAAVQVFARRGFYGASLDEIADTAGFTRGAIYKNFEDKEGLFLATLDHQNQRSLAAFSEWFDENPPEPRELDHLPLANAFRQILARDPDWFALELEGRLYALRNPEFRERYVANAREMTKAVAGFIRDLARSASFEWKVPPARLAHIFEMSAEGFLAWAFLDPDEGELFKTFVDLLLQAVVADD
ncbi:MAG TPA: TetR family transcriptional regulator [Acidimicrobiaceae bacterium]|nr:TetR family transcriptional regulator [Acidimicrobiaceae bacterium]